MNTMARVSAFVALLWASISYCFGTLANPELGYAVLVAAIVFIPLIIEGVAEDVRDVQKRMGRGG